LVDPCAALRIGLGPEGAACSRPPDAANVRGTHVWMGQ